MASCARSSNFCRCRYRDDWQHSDGNDVPSSGQSGNVSDTQDRDPGRSKDVEGAPRIPGASASPILGTHCTKIYTIGSVANLVVFCNSGRSPVGEAHILY